MKLLPYSHIFLTLLTLGMTAPAWGLAEEAGDDLQPMGFDTGVPIASTPRSPRPTSKIAENVTVITAREIAFLNAHTLAELLQTVPGIQLDKTGRTPGMFEFVTIQGANSQHLLVVVDGISQNEAGENMADLGAIPLQQIERVEIIKGGASAAWGQALGGVINIITKSPDPDQAFSATVFSSLGDKFTTDQRLEVSGTVERLGYYLTGGLLHSDGLLANNGINQNTLFGKVVYDLPAKGRLTLTLDAGNSRRGIEEVPPPDDWRDNYDRKRHASHLSLAYPLGEKLNLELDGHYAYLKTDTKQGMMTTPELWRHFLEDETDWGGRGKLVWGNRRLNLTSGMEYEHNRINLTETVTADPYYLIQKNFNRYGLFGNGTVSVGQVTILPGIRYDRVDGGHNEVSYTLGATCLLTPKNVLRSYFARGYSRSLAFMDNASPQKGWTTQIGAEIGEIPYLWLKGTLFYNNTWNMADPAGTGTVVSQVRQGVEVELRTVPLHGTTLSLGYTLTDLRDKETRTRVQGIPGDLLKLAVIYDNPVWGLHGILGGNYVWWNNPGVAADRNFIWDLRLNQKLLPAKELSPELFLTAHNLFNSAQYADYHYTNAGRWLEGGVRLRF